MAKLDQLPEKSIVDGLKGTVDFYYWNGIPVARSWPRSPSMPRTRAVQETWPTFNEAVKLWTYLPQLVRDTYIATSAGMKMSGRDLFVKSYLSGYFRSGQWGGDY